MIFTCMKQQHSIFMEALPDQLLLQKNTLQNLSDAFNKIVISDKEGNVYDLSAALTSTATKQTYYPGKLVQTL